MLIPKFSPISRIMKRVFYSGKKSVFIYTEDKASDRMFYKLLFDRIDDSNFDIVKVEPLGPKATVIETSIDDQNPSVPSLYIVDGDIKLMLGQALETENLIALDRYCIENFLCCKEGICQYLLVKLGTDKADIESKLDFESYIVKNLKPVLRLYYRYAVSQDICAGHGFKKFTQLMNPSTNEIDKSLVRNEIRAVETAIKNKLKADGYRSYRREMEERVKKVKGDNPESLETILKVISGKSHVLPLLIFKINDIDSSSSSLDTDQIKRLLAEKISMSAFDRINEKLLKLVS